jgi:hypothetical protein
MKLTQLTANELDKRIEESDNDSILVAKRVRFVNRAKYDPISGGFKESFEILTIIVEVRSNNNGDFVWRPAVASPLEDPQWKIEPRKFFVSYTIDDKYGFLTTKNQ